ncbi:unnamed protein product [Sphagnum jensenii]|uniref:Uncharacterized protein n=1 Tax=Sphagnum jensenii TaxID=128206 RepID=A0ABP1A734_9BRYO
MSSAAAAAAAQALSEKELEKMMKKKNRWVFTAALLQLLIRSKTKQAERASERARARDESNAVRRRAQDLGCNSSEEKTATLTAVPPRLRRRRARVGRVRGERARRGWGRGKTFLRGM